MTDDAWWVFLSLFLLAIGVAYRVLSDAKQGTERTADESEHSNVRHPSAGFERSHHSAGSSAASAEPAPNEAADERLREANATIDRLKAAGRVVIEQRDEARKAADERSRQISLLEAELERLRRSSSTETIGPDARFRAVKAAFARLYHPDRTRSDGIERLVREQVFKEFWAEIERIEREQGRQ